MALVPGVVFLAETGFERDNGKGGIVPRQKGIIATAIIQAESTQSGLLKTQFLTHGLQLFSST